MNYNDLSLVTTVESYKGEYLRGGIVMNRSLILLYSDKHMLQYSLDDGFKMKNKQLLKEMPYSVLKLDEDAFIIGEENG